MILLIFIRPGTIPAHDRQTDRRTDGQFAVANTRLALCAIAHKNQNQVVKKHYLQLLAHHALKVFFHLVSCSDNNHLLSNSSYDQILFSLNYDLSYPDLLAQLSSEHTCNAFEFNRHSTEKLLFPFPVPTFIISFT